MFDKNCKYEVIEWVFEPKLIGQTVTYVGLERTDFGTEYYKFEVDEPLYQPLKDEYLHNIYVCDDYLKANEAILERLTNKVIAENYNI